MPISAFPIARFRYALLALVFSCVLSSPCLSEEIDNDADRVSGAAGDEAFEEETLEEVSRKLENPLTTLWSLTLQENLSLKNGDLATLRKKFPDCLTQDTLTGTVNNLQFLFVMEQGFIKKPAEQSLGVLNPLAYQNQARQKSFAFDTIAPACSGP